MQNKDLPFCIFFVNFIFASRKNKHLREQEAMSNELCITGWTNPTLNTDRPTAALLGSLRRPVSFTLAQRNPTFPRRYRRAIVPSGTFLFTPVTDRRRLILASD